MPASLAALGCAAGGGSRNVAQSTPETYSQLLLRRKCQGCHRTPRPEKGSARAWQDALNRMKRKVKLTDADWDSLATLGSVDATIAPTAR
jgi:hypothetical protein